MKIIHTRRKTIALVIENDGNLIVRAPLRVSRKEIERIVRERSAWIQARQEWVTQHYGPPHQYKEGEFFYYLGTAYPLKFVSRQNKGLLVENSFQIELKNREQAPQIITNWYRNQARQVISDRVTSFATHHRLNYKNIRISCSHTRWGSCSSRGTLSFPYRLVMVPLDVIDYVVLHELAHLKIHSHAPDFWSYLEQICPNYRMQRKWLKEFGNKFTI
jgi:hypothetical protein